MLFCAPGMMLDYKGLQFHALTLKRDIRLGVLRCRLKAATK
jgi:hypothetical protein